VSQRIAKYEVLEKIAEGGFGIVYKARDPFIKRLVAIKTCSVADEDMARRFYREAEIAGRFDHPNVTIVHDFGVEDQTAYLVQEYLSGEDLLQKIRRRDALPLRQKVDYLIQVANGLAYAHSQQVIHRDIKPANLRVLETGQVKILDFGIAKLVSAGTQLTQKGMAVGTLGYLSPEQLRDQELDTRTDIFSYGVVAYELITYARPFSGKQLSALMDEILHRTPAPLVQHVSDCPPSLERVVARCLEKDRELRYQTFTEVGADLDEVRRELTASRPVAAEAGRPSPSTRDQKQRDGGPITRPIPLGDMAATTPSLPGPPPSKPAGPAPSMAAAAWPAPAQGASAAAGLRGAAAAAAVVAGPASGSVAAHEAVSPDARTSASFVPPPLPPPVPALPQSPAPPVYPAAAASPVEAQRAAPRAASRPIPWPWIAGGAAVVAIVLLAGAWLLFSFARRASEAKPAATPQAAQPVVPVAPTRATVVVLGTPWGTLESLRDAAGRDVPLPERRETPLVLALPPGHYVATLRHPNAPAPATCEVDAVNGQAVTCRAELLRVEPFQYFKEAGWWK
jgi:eukaryotic-like serine/threonine-protein kinase